MWCSSDLIIQESAQEGFLLITLDRFFSTESDSIKSKSRESGSVFVMHPTCLRLTMEKLTRTNGEFRYELF